MTSPTIRWSAATAPASSPYTGPTIPASGGTAPVVGDRIVFLLKADDGMTGFSTNPPVGSMIRTPVAPTGGWDYYAVWDTGILDSSGVTALAGNTYTIAGNDNGIMGVFIVSGSQGAAVITPTGGGNGASNPSWSGPGMTASDSMVVAVLRTAGAGAGSNPFTFAGGWTSIIDQEDGEGDNQWLVAHFNTANNTGTISVTCSQASDYIALGFESASGATNYNGTASLPIAAGLTTTGTVGIDGLIVLNDGTSTWLLNDGTSAWSWGSYAGGNYNGTSSLPLACGITASGVVGKSASATLALTATIHAAEFSDNGLGSTWFTDYSFAPKLIVNAEDWGLLSNAGLNHSGSFTATYDDYFSTRAAQGYTAWYGSWCSYPDLDGGRNGSDSDGTYPFSTNMDPSTTPDSTFWGRRDYFINSAATNGMRIFMNLTTSSLHYTDSREVPQRSWTTTQWTNFGTFIGTRYKSFPNIMWMVGDDYYDDVNTGLDAMLAAIRAAGDTHPISIQYSQENSSRKDYHSGGGGSKTWGTNAQFNWGYSYNVTYLVTEGMATESSPIPYFWADGYFLTNASSPFTDVQLMRRFIWWALSSGSKGFTVGDDDVWRWSSTALAQLTSKSFYTTVVPAIAAAFESITNWHLLVPDTTSALVTAGRGTHRSLYAGDSYYGSGGSPSGGGDDDNYVTASRTPDGSLAVIYCSKAFSITIDQSKLGIGYTATWMDPKTGATSAGTPGSTYNSGTAKGSNSDGQADWVLILQGPPVVTAYTGTTSLPLTDTIAASGLVGKVATGSLPLAAAITASGLVAESTSASLPLAATIAATGVVNRSASASMPLGINIAAGGSAASTGVSQSAAFPLADTITSTGSVGTLASASLPLAAAISASGAVAGSPQAAATLALGTAVTAAGRVNLSSDTAVSLIIEFDANGVLGTVAGSSVALTFGTHAAGIVGKFVDATSPLTATISATGRVDTPDFGSSTLPLVATIAASGITSSVFYTGGASRPLTVAITASGLVGEPHPNPIESPRVVLVKNEHTAVPSSPIGGPVDIYKQGDLAPSFTCILYDGKVPYDSTADESVHVKMWQDKVLIVDSPATTRSPDGTITYAWAPGDTDEPGPILVSVIVTKFGELPATFPPRGYMKVYVSPNTP